MGQNSSHFPVDQALQPGTYRIISGVAGTAIEVSNYDYNKIVAWQIHEGENQQWFLQRSGAGFRFQNRRHGTFLSVSSTDVQSLVYASRFPTTWIFLKRGDSYLIQYADNDRVLDLHNGWATNGNEIHIRQGDETLCKIWRLERLSDDTGEVLPDIFQEEGARLKRELHDKTESLSLKELELAEQREDVAEKTRELTRTKDELSKREHQLSEQRTLLSQREDTIRQLQQELKAKDEALYNTNKASEETTYLRDQQAHLQTKLSQQQNETAGLQAKMDRVEYLMSQMMGRDGRAPGDIP